MPTCPAQISGAHILYLLLCTSTESDPQSGISPPPPLSSRCSEDSNKSREPLRTKIPGFTRHAKKTLPEIPVSPIPPRSPLCPNPSLRASLMSTQTDSTNAPLPYWTIRHLHSFAVLCAHSTANVTSITPPPSLLLRILTRISTSSHSLRTITRHP